MRRAATTDMTEKMAWCDVMSRTRTNSNVHEALQSAIEVGTKDKGWALKRQDSIGSRQSRRNLRISLADRATGATRRQTEHIPKRSRTLQKLQRANTMNSRVDGLSLDAGEHSPKSVRSMRTSSSSIGTELSSPSHRFSSLVNPDRQSRKSLFSVKERSSVFTEEEVANTDKAVEQQLHKIPMFQHCSYDFVETLVLRLHTRILRPGQNAVEEDAAGPRSMFFVSLGSLEVLTMGEATGSWFCEGDAFGEDMVLNVGSRWHCSLRASGDTQCMVCELSHDSFEETLAAFPEEQRYFNGIRERFLSLSEAQDNGEQWKTLRRCAVLGRCSDDFLQKLDCLFIRRLFFPGEVLCSEGDEDGKLYVMERGSVVVSVADRTVRFEDVPKVRKKLVHGKEARSSGVGKRKLSVYSDQPTSERSSLCVPATGSLCAENSRLEDELAMHQLTDDVPEAAVFGEESLLGICPLMTKCLQAKSVSSVRILHRKPFLKLLEEYPTELVHLSDWSEPQQTAEEEEEEFAAAVLQERLPFVFDECSSEFFDFISKHIEQRLFRPGEIVTLDNLHKHVHHLSPETNISLCKIKHGQVRMIEKPKRAADGEDWGEECDLERLYAAFFTPEEQEPDPVEMGPGSIISGTELWEGHCVLAPEVTLVCILHRGVLATALELYAKDREVILPALQMHSHISLKKGGAKVAKILRDRSIFASASQEFIDEVIRCGVTRVFMPGDFIIEQDTDGTSMFILKLGSCSVVTEQSEEDGVTQTKIFTHVGVLPYGSVFGELVMLGVHPKRSASIIASTLCCTWEIAHTSCLGILNRHAAEKENFHKMVEEHLDKLAAPRMIHLALFSDFSQQFRTMLGVNCEKKLFFPGNTIVREGSTGDKLYIMNLGSASIEILEQHVMQVTGGSHFGFGTMAGTQDKYLATVVAESLCQVLVVTSAMYRNALRQYPDMIDVAKVVEANEKLVQSKQKDVFMQMVRRRRGLRCIVEALRGSVDEEDEDQEYQQQLLEITFQYWQGLWIRRAETQEREDEIQAGNMRRINEWLRKRQQQMDVVRPQNDMKRLIRHNLVRRGPLKLPEKPTSSHSPRKPKAETWDEIESPYLSPTPAWKVVAVARKSPRRLEPLSPSMSSPASARSSRRPPPLSPWSSERREIARNREGSRREDRADSDSPGDAVEEECSKNFRRSFLLAAGNPLESLMDINTNRSSLCF